MTDLDNSFYRVLTSRRTLEHCNDASLALQDIDNTYRAVHPDDRDDELLY